MADKDEQEKVDDQADEDVAIRWTAPKFVFYKKDVRWYGSVIAAGAVLLLLTFWLREALLISIWLLIPVIVLAVIALVSRGMVQPPQVPYALTEDGVEVEAQVHPYSQFRSFSVIDMNDHYVLRLWPKTRWFLPLTIVLSNEVVPEDIREILAEALPEGDHEATISDWISHYTKF